MLQYRSCAEADSQAIPLSVVLARRSLDLPCVTKHFRLVLLRLVEDELVKIRSSSVGQV